MIYETQLQALLTSLCKGLHILGKNCIAAIKDKNIEQQKSHSEAFLEPHEDELY